MASKRLASAGRAQSSGREPEALSVASEDCPPWRWGVLTDAEVRELFRLVDRGIPLVHAARAIGRSERAARRYVKKRRLPSQMKHPRTYRTRMDAFEDVWPDLEQRLKDAPGLEAKTLFGYLCRQEPGRYQEGQLRTLQRRVRDWRALQGPDREVYFDQVHHPGERGETDFTVMDKLEITIAGAPFPHLLYHFVLPYSNWEYAEIAFSESFLALRQGVQNALWTLGGVPRDHRTDNSSSATHDLKQERGRAFNDNYQRFMKHYGLRPTTNSVGKGNENGDVEKSHDLFKREVNQRLLLAGSRDFATRGDYESFLREVVRARNELRSERFNEELKALNPLPARRMNDYLEVEVRVRRGSTITLLQNVYSVPARLIGHTVKVRLFAEHLELRYGQQVVERIQRLHGTHQARVNYRHVIGWLVRKPGAFADYRFREELFPTLAFRRAYDALCEAQPVGATLEYLRILKLAAETLECQVAEVLEEALARGEVPSSEMVREAVNPRPATRPEVRVQEPNPAQYDDLLTQDEEPQEVAA